MSTEEHRDPVVKDIIDQVPPPAHGADFWSNLDATLASEPAPNTVVPLEPVLPEVLPGFEQAPEAVPVQHQEQAEGGPGHGGPGGQNSNVVSLDDRRRNRILMSVAAAALVVVGVAGFAIGRNNGGIVDDSALPVPTEVEESEAPPPDNSEAPPPENPFEYSSMSPNTNFLYGTVGLDSLDESGASYHIRTDADVDPDAVCEKRELVIRRDGTYSDELLVLRADEYQILRDNTGRMIIIEHCGTESDRETTRLQRVLIAQELPEGGFASEAQVVELDGAPSEFKGAQWGGGVLANGMVGINLETGEVVSAADCSGITIAALPLAEGKTFDDPVNATRTALQQAAGLCDWQSLRNLMGSQFEGDVDTVIDEWIEAETDSTDPYRPMGQLVGVLNTGEAVILDSESNSDDQLWSWPRAVIFACEDMPETAKDELDERLGYTADQLDQDCDAIGAYAGWRLAIDMDGNWRYFKRS